MPLFELFRMSKGKLDSSQEKPSSCSNDSTLPENNFAELVWENGQVMIQGQSSRGRKTLLDDNSCFKPSLGDTNRGGKIPLDDISCFKPSFGDTNTRIGKRSLECGGLCELPVSAPSCGIGVNQDEDIVPWLNYPIGGGPLQNAYGSDILPEFMGVSVNGVSLQHSHEIMDKSCTRLYRNSDTSSLQNDVGLGQVNALKLSPCTIETTKTRTNTNQPDPSSPLQSKRSLPSFRSRAGDSLGTSTSGVTCPVVSKYSTRLTTPVAVHSSVKVQRLDSGPSNSSDGLTNFPCCTRPAYLSKDIVEDRRRADSSMPPHELRSDMRYKISGVGGLNLSDPNFVISGGSKPKETRDGNQNLVANENVDEKKVDAKKYDDTLSSKHSRVLSMEVASKNDKFTDHSSNKENEIKGIPDNERTTEPVFAGTSSVCSDNSVERGNSDDQRPNLKRKSRDTEESDGPSEEVEEDLVTVKKQTSTRSSSVRRSRAAEVHNLSERRRRDRINEKMRALQELIPNCNKVDKASMLDEAIEYLKSLQLQVQVMMMGAGMYMQHMMLPTGMQHMHPAPFPQMPRMGVGMGFGMGMVDINGAAPGCPMIQVPPMQGAHYPNPRMSGPPAFHGMPGSNLQIFGLPVKGLPLSMPCPPFIPLPGGPLMKSAPGIKTHGVPGTLENPDLAPPSGSKEQVHNTGKQAGQSGVSSCLTNHLQADLVQNISPSSKVNGGRAAELVNEKGTGRARVSHK